MKDKVCFVTGSSKGMGKNIVQALLNQGYRVAACSRDREKLVELFGEMTERFLPIGMDLRQEEEVRAALHKARSHFGAIDVVINNAGYAQNGFLEEVTDQEIRAEYDVNVFGLLHVIRNVLSIMREQGRGHIINISSKGGFHAGAATGAYCSSKYAVEGLSEALYFEMKPHHIHVTAVKPGGIRTNFYDNLRQSKQIDCYQEFHEKEMEQRKGYAGYEPGDPEKVAKLLIQVIESEEPPLHLFVGKDAYRSPVKKYNEVKRDMDAWEQAATNIDFDVL